MEAEYQGQESEGVGVISPEPACWTLWKVWDLSIYEMIETCNSQNVSISNTCLAEKVMKLVSPTGSIPASYVNLFQFEKVVEFREWVNHGALLTKIVIQVNSMTDNKTAWGVTAFNELARIFNDHLKEQDLILIWGGYVKPRRRSITLNISRKSTLVPDSYVAMYRHNIAQGRHTFVQHIDAVLQSSSVF